MNHWMVWNGYEDIRKTGVKIDPPHIGWKAFFTTDEA